MTCAAMFAERLTEVLRAGYLSISYRTLSRVLLTSPNVELNLHQGTAGGANVNVPGQRLGSRDSGLRYVFILNLAGRAKVTHAVSLPCFCPPQLCPAAGTD